MIRTVSISGYRGFSRFEMGDLALVNLLVGRNNSGKTSVLEAIYLLASGGDIAALWRILTKRGEHLDLESGRRQREIEFDVSHLFSGHELKPGTAINLASKNRAASRNVTLKLERIEERNSGNEDSEISSISSRLVLTVSGTPQQSVDRIPLTRHGGLDFDLFDRPARVRPRGRGPSLRAAQYITTESLAVSELTAMWNDIVLTDTEELVLEALRHIDPEIERIAAVSPQPYYFSPYFAPSGRGGFKVKLRKTNQPIPIGSLGDGTWRMLALAIAIIQSKDGVLLVDEIDTGLHYTVMDQMWRFIVNSAKQFNVQVFATTHSYDCVYSLATASHRLPNEEGRKISIQRIESGKGRSVPYSESEIRVAAERDIELR